MLKFERLADGGTQRGDSRQSIRAGGRRRRRRTGLGRVVALTAAPGAAGEAHQRRLRLSGGVEAPVSGPRCAVSLFPPSAQERRCSRWLRSWLQDIGLN